MKTEQEFTDLSMSREEYNQARVRNSNRSVLDQFPATRFAFSMLPEPDRAEGEGNPLDNGYSKNVFEWDQPGPFGDAPYVLRVTFETIPIRERRS